LGNLVVRASLYALTALALAGCGSQAPPRVQPLTFHGIAAYLVRPAKEGTYPAVVVVHGSGGDRSELLPVAKELARHGLVALTITAPSSTPPASQPANVDELLADARRAQLGDVAAVEAAADRLAHTRGVDAAGLGYLGWSAGAKTGAFVARDGRFRALALLSAGAAPVETFVSTAPAASRAKVRRVLTQIDPLRAIARGRPGSILLEDGLRDEIVPRQALQNMIRAAPPRTTVRWYDTPHALSDRAYADARSWLYARLQ
jgi:dienelactone hydrolase